MPSLFHSRQRPKDFILLCRLFPLYLDLNMIGSCGVRIVTLRLADMQLCNTLIDPRQRIEVENS